MFSYKQTEIYIYLQLIFVSSNGFFISDLTDSVKPQSPDTPEQGNVKNNVWNFTYTDLLKRDLLAHYDKFARPTQHGNATTVKLDLAFKHIELDDTKSIMTVNGWMRMYWVDEKLKWNSSEYGGLKLLHIGDHEIWEPDILLYNSAIGNNIDHYGNTLLTVTNDGMVLWIPPCQFQVFCEMNLTKWPFDRHTCKLILASWSHAGDTIDLTINATAPIEIHQGSYNWNVISITKKRVVTYYTCCPEPYYDVQYSVTLERVSCAYYITVFAPAIGVIFLCLSIFWIPTYSSSRFILGGITELLQVIFFVYLLQRLSRIGPTTPLIILFYGYGIILTAVSIVESLFCYNIAVIFNLKPVPWSLANMLNSKYSSFLLLPKYQNWSMDQRGCEELVERSTLDEDREDLTSIRNHTKRPVTAEWAIVATALDRLTFFLYFIFYIGFAIKCLL